ncbi:MAG: discoidin domain-containing protein, partial [Phycisphaeraceae bacterium]|nr:discoidin domain-containing protein [Phycisphaeraceae bacterium]
MKRKLLCFAFIVSCLVMGTAWGLDDPVGVPWGEWRFSGAFDGASEVLADKASAPGSLMRINAGSTAITQADNVVIVSETGPGDYLRVDIDDVMENGGGAYVNEYTMIFDVKAAQADWLPIYNTGSDNYNAADFWMNAEGALGSGSYSDAGVMPPNTWVRLVVVRMLEGGSWVRDVYVDGTLVFGDLGAEGGDGNSSLYTNAQEDEGQFTILSDSDATVYAGCELANFAFVSMALSAEAVADLSEFNEGGIFDVSSVGASKPLPDEEAVDVLRNATLSWNPGVLAGTHDVYFGEALADVSGATRSNPMGVQLVQGQAATSTDTGRLTFGQTYYWRVDEVNATPDHTIFSGEVWNFTVEPYSIQIPGATVTVTASSASNEFSIPDRTMDGSGLGEDDAHTISPEAMWFTATGDTDPWIQYGFDTVHKLDTMKVWNSNSSAEMAIGWGVKDVQIEYSADGQNWDVLTGATQLSRAPGLPTYNQYDEIDFGGAAARYVRLNIQSNWGGVLMSYSLSEVQFYSIPAAARTPEPASGSADVLPNAVVSWRTGRDAAQHTVYVGTDMDAVADGTAPSATSMTNSLDLSSQNLQLGETYYWRVDEVNEAQVPSVWAGPVWSLSTSAVLVVDDFESYRNNSPDRPFQTWLDGFGYSDDEFFSIGYGGNGTGAGVGHDIWSLSSPNFDETIMEGSITLEGSSQSMPFYYDNSGAASQTDRTWATSQDWTVGGAASLVLYFYGSEDNTGGPLFVEIN